MIIMLLLIAGLIPVVASLSGAAKAYAAGIASYSALAVISFYTLMSGSMETIAFGQYITLGNDPLSSLFLFMLSVVWLVSSIFSIEYDRDSFSNSFSFTLAIFAMVVLLVSRSFPVFLSGWETMTIAGYLLIGFRNGMTRIPPYVFLVYGELSTLLIIVMAAGMFFQTGSTDFIPAHYSQVLVFLGITGFFIKMGVMPFQITEWLPIAHGNASTNGSILFSATMTTAAVYSILRFISISFEGEIFGYLLMSIGAFSLLFASVYSASSEHVKMLPAYSTIENSGAMLILAGAYIIFNNAGMAQMSTFALLALLIFVFAHAIAKGGLFMFGGILERSTGSSEIKSYHGGNNSTYYGAGGFLVASSLSGMLPIGGGVGEWMLLETLFVMATMGQSTLTLISTVVGAMAALGGGISIISMTKIFGYGSRGSHEREKREGPMRTALLISGLTVAIIGLMATALAALMNGTVHELTGNETSILITGALLIPHGFLLASYSSSGVFGAISPLFVAVFVFIFSGATYALLRRAERRPVPNWTGGIAAEDTLHSFAYANSLRLTMRRFYLTKEEREGRIYSERTFDAFWIFMIALSRKTVSFSRSFGRFIMNSSLSAYVFYIIIATFAVLIFVTA